MVLATNTDYMPTEDKFARIFMYETNEQVKESNQWKHTQYI